jgi:threonine dehydrogenase-like Zn-dependent dehydrogenase
MGHEFTGTVDEVGDDVKTLQQGDMVVAPFTVSCGKCFFCKNGLSSRCQQSRLFGSAALDGGQAEYVRIPLADTTVVKAPDGIEELKLCLMADIFPTGYFAAANAFKDSTEEQIRDSTVVLFGCGPVGLCALVSALTYKPRALLAVDGVDSRLATARDLGAEAWNYQDPDALAARVNELTDGRGADMVIEVVGHSSALDLGFKLLRPWGRMSSVGVHNGEIPWTGNQAYGKNLTIQMGRCPVRSKFSPLHESQSSTSFHGSARRQGSPDFRVILLALSFLPHWTDLLLQVSSKRHSQRLRSNNTCLGMLIMMPPAMVHWPPVWSRANGRS